VTVNEQLNVVDPQSAGETMTPGDPAATTDAGISVPLVLDTAKWRVPVPLTVKGREVDVVDVLASIERSVRLVIVGDAKVASAPIASTRPYPNVLSGTLALS
jgi:hypothetical protein